MSGGAGCDRSMSEQRRMTISVECGRSAVALSKSTVIRQGRTSHGWRLLGRFRAATGFGRPLERAPGRRGRATELAGDLAPGAS